MNRIIQEQWPMFEAMKTLRGQMLDILSDDDLSFNPGGQNISLGGLCREMGDIEYSYIESLKTFKQDWTYRNTEAGLETSISQLRTWYDKLDSDLKETISALTDEDFTKTIDRGFPMLLQYQLQAYIQAALILFGKATIYLKAMNKALPKQMEEWIG